LTGKAAYVAQGFESHDRAEFRVDKLIVRARKKCLPAKLTGGSLPQAREERRERLWLMTNYGIWIFPVFGG
jgi:hypothetical protein